jgi:predicted Zn-dependent protease with MMP-like domain
MSAKLNLFEHYRKLAAGTTIDSSTLLSTDYFNLFNEVIMLLGMLPDMPDMLEEVSAWQFKTYAQHFAESGLAFAPLAIDAYPHAPAPARAAFEEVVEKMRQMIEEAKRVLSEDLAGDELDLFAGKAIGYSLELQRLVDTGSAIVHGRDASLDQSAIDDLF